MTPTIAPSDRFTNVLSRILDAAHHAPSGGLMQAWELIVIADADVRAQALAQLSAAAGRRR
jgi:5,6-dimethylbenzimidazole synthase